VRTVFQAQYFTGDAPQMRQEDYDATFLVQAVKGATLNQRQFSWVTISGKNVKITHANQDETLLWFAEWAAPQIDALGNGTKVLVPVPNSHVTKNSKPEFRTAQMADALAKQLGNAVAAPVLRWKKPMTPSHKGGTRDKNKLYPALEIVGAIPNGTIILVDDVSTGGGHMTACAWKLEDIQRSPAMAVCCGRTVHHQLDNPFQINPEEVDLKR